MQPDTLPALLDRSVERAPDAVAVIERDAGDTRMTTYAQLRERAGAAAAELAAHGVRPGDVVGVWLPNWTEWLVIEFALARLGAGVIGVNTRYGVHELAHLLWRGRPAGLVLPGAFLEIDFAGRLEAAMAQVRERDGVARPPWVATVRDGDGPDVGGGAWRFGATAGDVADAAAPAAPMNYFTTSGSTGFPKLAGHDQAAVARHAVNAAAAFDVRAGDVVAGVLPLSGVFGFNPALAALSAGATCLLEPVFDAPQVLADMEAFAVTHVAGGDDMLGRVMDAWLDDPRPLPAFRRGGIADFAGRSEAVVAWGERELGARISGVYGSSELFALTAIAPAELPLARRSRGGGVPVSEAIEFRVVDPAGGAPCRPGEVGELQFRGYNVLTDYRGDPGARHDAFTADGWFRSGDLGELTADPPGFAYVCRAGDALRLRGFLVEPAEIEQFLMGHPAVDGARVVGVRAADGADTAVAFVTLRAGATADAALLLDHCRQQLAPFKRPAAINVIDAFPVTTGTNGTKIRTAELRERAARQLGEPAAAR